MQLLLLLLLCSGWSLCSPLHLASRRGSPSPSPFFSAQLLIPVTEVAPDRHRRCC